MEITVDAKSHAEVRFRDPDNGKMVSLKLNEPSPKNLVEAARELMLRYFVARQATEEKEATE
ncbi:MAG: hypothetical protein UY05_C0011G0001 [Candidatus Peregrinibacteria bacterium GW2011_GWA2_47_7]|nr:MAG: hypothetical protein UY05_C0011G0001 [Candidatus Peregrinibacteria bacterium GW2011_GWA2_47_7]